MSSHFIINKMSIPILGGSILSDVLAAGFSMNHGCKDGRCRNCPVKNNVTGQNKLACQTAPKPNEDFYCGSFTEDPMPRQLNIPAKFIENKKIGNFHLLKFKFSSTLNISYNPGQYLEIDIKNLKRSYSIFNVDNEKKNIEILFSPVEGGLATRFFQSHESIGSVLRINIPQGTFTIGKCPPNTVLIFICTGTGISPVLNIVNNSDLSNKKYKIYWGFRNNCQFTQSVLTAIPKNLEVFPSREGDAGGKPSQRIPIKSVVASQLNDNNVKWFFCGNPNMIDEAERSVYENTGSIDNVTKDPFIMNR